MTVATIGVIGLGAMGGPAAAALVASGLRVRGSDPSPVAVAAAAAAGVEIVDSVARTASELDVLLLSLPGPAQVLDVAVQLQQVGTEALVINLSTIDPDSARRAAELVGRAGGRYLDAPVLGRPDRIGRWTLVAGGAEADVDEARELCVGTIAAAVQWVGDVGAGSTLKICNNLMFAAINTVTAEVVDLAAASGLDPAVFATIVAESGAATVSGLFREVAPKMASGDYDPTFSVRLLQKDIGLGRDLATTNGRDVPLTTLVELITRAAVDLDLGDQDTAAVVEVYRRSTGRPDLGSPNHPR